MIHLNRTFFNHKVNFVPFSINLYKDLKYNFIGGGIKKLLGNVEGILVVGDMEGFVDGISVSGDVLGDAEGSLISGDAPEKNIFEPQNKFHTILNKLM